MYSVPGNKLCWNVIVQLELAAVESEQFRNSEWAPESNKRILNHVRHFKTIYGTLGDIIDATNDEGVNRVFFEDMLYETWNHGRTVLIGDGTYFISFCTTDFFFFFALPLELTISFFFQYLLTPHHSCAQGTCDCLSK
jgi:hypothetical protein